MLLIKNILTFYLHKKSDCFYETNTDKQISIESTCKIIFNLYKTLADDKIEKQKLTVDDSDIENSIVKYSLNKLKYYQYKRAINSTFFKIDSLPPAESAAVYHAYYVYLQVQLWCGNTNIDATEWGWFQTNIGNELFFGGNLIPEEIVQKIFCMCKKKCRTMLCTCRKLKKNFSFL